ncbi:MAG: hypothetical protein IKK34_07845 [Clostridia bacterium]|nr:hypothetical protein [Clostridia bacterium]
MDSIIYRQQCAAKPLTGKGFLLAVAGILLRLAAAQVIINLLIAASGLGILNIAFYLYVVWLLFCFMRKTVACYVYTLKTGSIVLERRLGDSPITVVQIPLNSIAAMRPVRRGERLKTTYRQVTEIDPACRPGLRVRTAFALSLVSAHLARLCAGKGMEETIGHVLVFDEENQRRACVFAPDEKMLAALKEQLGDAFGFDERMTHARVATLYGRALERAFPALYPYVDPLVSREAVKWAKEEIDRQKAERQAKKPANAKPKSGGKLPKEEAGNEPHEGEMFREGRGGANRNQPRRRRKQG